MYVNANIICLLLIFAFQFQAHAQQFLPCLKQSNYTSNWTCLGPFNELDKIKNQHFGAVNSISVNPFDSNEIFVGAMSSGLFHTNNRGQSWECLTDQFEYPVLGVNDIWVDYTRKPYTILLATGSTNSWYDAINVGILKSTDGGKTWQKHYTEKPDLFTSIDLQGLRFDKQHQIFYAYGKHKIIRSANFGDTWEDIFSTDIFPTSFYDRDFEIISMEISPNGKQLFFTTYANPIYTTNNDSLLRENDFNILNHCEGPTKQIEFEKLTNLLKCAHPMDIANPTFALKLTKQHPDSPYLFLDRTFHKSVEHVIYTFNIHDKKVVHTVSPNNGSLAEDIYWRAGLRIHPYNSSIMYLAGNQLYKSIDSGKTFTALYDYSFGENNVPHADIRHIHFASFSANGLQDKIYLGTDGGISFSNNSGATFECLNGTSLPITQFYGLGVSPFTGNISAGSQDNSIMSYVPTSNTWITEIRGDGYDVEYSKRFLHTAYGEYNANRLFKTLQDKAPFDQYCHPNNATGISNKKSIYAHSNGNVYFASNQVHILHASNGKWTSHRTGAPNTLLSIAVAETDSNIIYASSYWNGLYKSTDGGQTFQDISSLVKINGEDKANTRIHAICISPYDENNIWISLGYFGDYTNPCKQTSRVLHSEDGGLNWKDYSEGLPVYYLTDLIFLEGTEEALFASCFEGVFFRESSSTPWTLFSTNLPKSIISELKISYCQGKLLAATYGRGLWETDLPNIKYTNEWVLKKPYTFQTKDSNEAISIHRNIRLKSKASLNIDCEIHMAKGTKIIAKKNTQIKLTPKGKIVYDCGEKVRTYSDR